MGLNILIVVLSTLASLIAFPVAGGFRITLAVVVLFGFIHAYKIKRPMLLATVTGIAIVLCRILFDSFRVDMTGALASNYLWEFFFYPGYGLIYYYAITKNTSEYPLPLVAALTLADTGGNFLEYYLRHLGADEAWAQTSLATILIAAAIRSILIVILVWILNRFAKAPGEPVERGRP